MPSPGLKLLLGWVLFVATLLIARQLERVRPIDRIVSSADREHVAFDYKISIANLLLTKALTPLAAPCAVAIVTAAGGGFINLESSSWSGMIGGAIFYIVMLDLYGYWLHRLQHKIPVLWAMHSFHHSAERLTVVTGARHYWVLSVMTIAFFPIMDIFFSISPKVVFFVSAINAIPNGLAHLNYRVPLGRFVTWVNNPQWHRIHHSTNQEHIDKNFANLFPVMDFIFGTAVLPKPDEYPPTGLVPSEKIDFVGAMLWPWRAALRGSSRRRRGTAG